MYHQVQYSRILHGTPISFVCFVWISEQTANFTFCIIQCFFNNRGGDCLLELILLAPVVIKLSSESGRDLRCDDCNNAFHEKYIPKYHKQHIPISEDGD